MKRPRRRLAIVLVILVVIAAFGLAVMLRRNAPPEAARLLPESDAIVFLNLKNIRRFTSFSPQPAGSREPKYEQFVQETGLEFERDLDEAAVGVHVGLAGGENRYSCIFVGRYDSGKLAAYLRKTSRSMETYRQVDVYSVSVENRTLRVALLAFDTIAVSNVDDASVIHGMIDRDKQAALPVGGPTLLREYYRYVPFGSLAWTVAKIPTPPSDPRKSRAFTLPGGVDVSIPPDTYLVGSVRALTALHGRVEFFMRSPDEARQFTQNTSTVLLLMRGLEGTVPPSGGDSEAKSIFDSLKVEQSDSRAVITAEVPMAILHKLLTEPPQAPAPEPPKVPPDKPRRH